MLCTVVKSDREIKLRKGVIGTGEFEGEGDDGGSCADAETPFGQGRNEELARKAAKTSEEDIKTLTDEYEARLGAAERKVYALTKERDMLKRGQEKLTSATDLVKEKDSIIAQVTQLVAFSLLLHPPNFLSLWCRLCWLLIRGWVSWSGLSASVEGGLLFASFPHFAVLRCSLGLQWGWNVSLLVLWPYLTAK